MSQSDETHVNLKNISGKYKMTKNENWDAYLQKMGVGYLQRKMMSATSAGIQVLYDEKEKEYCENILVMGFAVNENKFKIDEEFLGSMVDKTKFNSRVKLQGDIMYQTFDRADTKCSVTRDFSQAGTFVMTLVSDDVEAKQIYEKST